MIMDSTSIDIGQPQSTAYALMKRGKRGAAALIASDINVAAAAAAAAQQLLQEDISDDAAAVAAAMVPCKILDHMLDVLLNPYDAIGEWNNLDWLRWLMAGGKTLDEFSSAVKDFDYGTCCGLVWTANYVAYRCRTCSISPCMSLCGDCFKRGDHTGHDFNMFRSQAGGACDCGDTSVMKPDGFCHKHSSTNNLDGSNGSSSSRNGKQPPADLLRVAERIMPRLLLRLVQYLRENSKNSDSRSTANIQQAPAGSVGNTGTGTNQQQPNLPLSDLDPFLAMLHDLSALGAAMRRVMTVSLTNEKIYQWACDYYSKTKNIVGNDSNIQEHQEQQTIYNIYTEKVRRYYLEAIKQYTTSSSSSSRRRRRSSTSSEDIPLSNSSSQSSSEDDEFNEECNPDNWSDDDQNTRRNNKLSHSSFLQEIVFWTVRYEFPQKMVCLLLNMLPDASYKEALTEAFVMHYGCVARVLETTKDSDTLSNHIVHISVQLFSNEALATRMVDKLGLLRVMVSSLRRMMTKILIPSTLHDSTKNRHRVVDCSKAVMKEHCYWPLVSDLNNVLSHRPIAVKFMCDDRLLDSWFSYLSMFQGMNVNCRELGHHVEFEPNTYYAAFSAELEASAYPMWALLSHLTSADTWPLTSRVLNACLQRLRKWLIDVGYYINKSDVKVASSSADFNSQNNSAIIRKPDDRHQFTFHLPLHRYLAVFLCQAVRAQGACIEDIIPRSSTGDTTERDSLLLAIASHPVRAQSAFYEIMQGAWVRNGLQIKGQAMTYIQSNFCISMVDADIYLLQLCLSELSDVNIFMTLILEKFKTYEWMRVIKNGGLPQVMDSIDFDVVPSMESLLVFLATLVGVRTNLCSDEDYDYCQTQLEMVTLLCVSDKTHSQLMELMPERCGGGTQTATTTTSSSVSSDTSQNLPPLDQESTPSRDFETVLQAVAEYKRPQFEASGNMQQGLYVPLAHVWQNLYDPVHVLLRAVHRRDFQSSMDRYTTFMRSIGLLRQNQNPWPPYRTPQKHHSAYRDPRRALLSRMFHAVAWHCLYRSAVYRDVSEHTLSLLVYLLDQAWICYTSSSSDIDRKTTTNQQELPMDIDPPIKPFVLSKEYSGENLRNDTDENISLEKHIIISATDSNFCEIKNNTDNEINTPLLLIDRWYDNDDLAQNLCTTITHIELPPPLLHYHFKNTPEDITNPTSSTAAASTMATNLFDYFTSSVAAAASAAASSSSSISISHNNETVNSQDQQPNIAPSLAVIAGNEIPITSPRSSHHPNIAVRPPFYSLNAAAAATSSTMDSALNHVKQRLQFLRPPQKMMTPLEQQQSSSSAEQQSAITDMEATATSHQLFDIEGTTNDDTFEGAASISGKHQDDIENMMVEETIDDYQEISLVSINESIISLLLKLHSQLSGRPDSYQPTPSMPATTSDSIDEMMTEEIPPCGDGAFHVGRLLDRIAKGSTSCYECIVRTRLSLWPKAVVMRETATREDEERERRERKRRARDKQQQMMEEMARAQQAFLESARLSGDLDSTDTQSQIQTQSTSTTNSITTNMECDEPVATVDTSTATTSSGNANTSLLSNVVIDIDENSSSSNSTTTTTKEQMVGVRSQHQESMLTVDCVICNQTVVVQLEQQRRDPVGLVILVQGTNVLAHRRHILPSQTATKNQYINSSNNTNEQQPIEIGTTVTNSDTINDDNTSRDEDEQNYYRYWPALPPLQSNPQQNISNLSPDSQLKHHLALMATLVDDNDTTTYASHSDRRKRHMNQYFSNMDMADLVIGALTTTTSATDTFGGNVHVQTCGHHLHLRCWSSYLSSLRGAQRFNADRGEYSCPLCRQLANSLMPLMPVDQHQQQNRNASNTIIMTTTDMSDAIHELSEMVEHESVKAKSLAFNICGGESSVTDENQIVEELQQHLQSLPDDGVLPGHVLDDGAARSEEDSVGGNEIEIGDEIEISEDPLVDAVNQCVSDMIFSTAVTLPPPAPSTANPRDNSIRWHNVVSVAWTNIQVELVQRNNSLIQQSQQNEWSLLLCGKYCHHQNKSSCASAIVSSADNSGNNNYYDMLPKRNCIGPLLKVLRLSARSLMVQYQTPDFNPLSDIWNKLIGLKYEECTDPPLLMRDPCSVLLQLVLLLPTLERDLFDTLIKLTYNMQLYAAALKVAVTWNNNRHRRHSCRHLNSKTSHEMVVGIKEDDNIDSSRSSRMDIGDSNSGVQPSSSSMDITKDDNSPPLFSQVVSFAKSVVFLSQDNDVLNVDTDGMMENEDEFMMYLDDSDDNVFGDHKGDVPIAVIDDELENTMLLESYGRQCTLPFLRFAALLKKYTFGNDDDNLDVHRELKSLSSLPLQQQQNTLNADQHNLKDHSYDNETRFELHKKHFPPMAEANYKVEDLTKHSPHCQKNICHNHWSRDDNEFLLLAHYLKLLNNSKEHDEKAFKDCDCGEEYYDCCENNDEFDHSDSKIKECTLMKLPSAVEAVNWPYWSHKGVTNKSNIIATAISRDWYTCFRESLTVNTPNSIVYKNTTTDAAKIDPNSNASTSANIVMITRMLLAVDCCDGGGVAHSHQISSNSGSIPTTDRRFLPTVNWMGPRLLRLPHLYDDVFQYYHGRPCHRCHGVPREASVCLVCGTVVCLKENCCKTNGVFEAVQHSLECGGGTGMFLVVTSSSVVVIRGKRACLWGSVYLDAFGEEDRELKRGKPLYLSAERYRLLERQWLAHRFDHTNKKWVWHRDAL